MPLAAGCGNDDETPATAGQQGEDAAMKMDDADAAMNKDNDAMAKGRPRCHGQGRRRRHGQGHDGHDRRFRVRRDALRLEEAGIHIFEKDPKGETVSYDECAEAWPPVFTEGMPLAGKGVDASLLGTLKRRDGTLQVTYADQPLYCYAHEKADEVRCHNVNLNGGLRWVIGPDGKRRP